MPQPAANKIVVPTTVNADLANRAVRHQVLLEQLKNSEVRRAIAVLNKRVLEGYIERWEAIVSRMVRSGSRSAVERSKVVQGHLRKLKQYASQGIESLYVQTSRRLERIAIEEAKWQRNAIQTAAPVELGVTLPSPKFLKAIVTSRPMAGRLLRSWFRGLSANLQQRSTQAINLGLALGESVPQISRRLRDVAGVTRRHAETVVRTAVNHVTSQAKNETFKANSDLIKRWQFIATLDDRTTLICASYDGKTFPIGTGPIPPLHMACRSTSAPVLAGWKELGLKDPPPSTRASMNGQVADKLTYGEWLKNQPPDIQDRVLGKTRAQMFREGRVSIERFTTDKGRVLTLEQLKEIEKD